MKHQVGRDDERKVETAIADYVRRYGLDLPDGLSDRYDLQTQWHTTTIPNADKQGCYFIFDEIERLLYVGKASLRNTIGRRVSTYFYSDSPGASVTFQHDGWTAKPSFIRTLPVQHPYEAASLEEYLIDCLAPIDNTQK